MGVNFASRLKLAVWAHSFENKTSPKGINPTSEVSPGHLPRLVNFYIILILAVFLSNFVLAKPAAADPEISISSSESGALADGATDDQGVEPAGTAKTVTYTVDNSTGSSDLFVSSFSATNLTNISGPVTVSFSSFTVIAGIATNITVTYTPAGDGPFSFDLDIVSNDPDEGNFDILVSGTAPDTTAPTALSLVRLSPTAISTNADALSWRVTFDEAVQNVDAMDFQIVGTTASLNVSGSGTTYDLTLSGGDLAGLNGSVSIGFASGQDIQDLAGNAFGRTISGANESTFFLDNGQDTVSITTASPTVTGEFAVSLAFVQNGLSSAPRSGPTSLSTVLSALQITNGTRTGGSSFGGSTVGFNVTPINPGPVTVSLPAGVAFDDAGNPTQASNLLSVTALDTVAPTVFSIARQTPADSRTNADSLTFRVTFDEDVQNVDQADFSPSGVSGATIGVTPVSASVYDVTVSGGNVASFTGSVFLSLVPPATLTISDLAGNAMTNVTPTASVGYTLDNDPPEVSSTAINGGPQSAGNTGVGFLVTFSGNVGATNVSADDFTLTTTGSATGTIQAPSDLGGSVYLVSVSNLGGDGSVRLDLKANTDIADDLGNAGPSAFTTGAFHIVDRQGPALTSIERQNPTVEVTRDNGLIFRVTFNEDVQNVDVADFGATGVTGASIAVTPIAASVYDVTVSGGNLANFNGNVGLQLVASPTISDLLGNALTSSAATGSVETYTLDNTAPEATSIALNGGPQPASSSSVDYIVVFTEAAANVTTNDFTLTTSGSASGTIGTPVINSTTSFRVPVTGITGSGTIRLDLKANTDIADALGNDGPAAFTTGQVHTVDQQAPTVISILRQNPVAEFTDADSLTFRVTFSEDLQNVDLGDFQVGGPTGATIGVTPVSASVYDITVSGGDLAALNAPVSLSLLAGQDIQDLGGNALSNITPGTAESYVVDNTAPGVTISSTSSGTVTAAFPISVVFSEAVVGFVEAEMVVAGASVTNFMTSDNTTFTATLTPTGDGTVTVDVAAGVAQDGTGADNTAATQFSIGSDVTAPTLTIVGPAGAQTGDFTITINADEHVSGFTLGDIAVTNATPANLSASSGTSFTVDITNPTVGATVDVTIAAGAVQDDAGISNAAAANYKVSAGSPVSEFEDNKTEVIDAVQADVRRDLQNDISANQKMMDGAMGRFIDSGNGDSAARDVPFDVTGFAEVTGDGLITQGQFYGFDHLGSGHARYVFGQFDVTRDEGGSTTGQLSGRMVWERPLSESATLGYFVGARVGQSDIKGAFNGDATTFGVLGGVYAMQRLGKSTFGAGYLGVGQSWSDLSMSDGTLGLSGTYDYTSYYAGLELAGRVALSTAVEMRPNLAVDYAYAEVGVTGLDATAFGLAAPVSADFGSVWVLESSLTPEIIWSLAQAGTQSTSLTIAPSLICREEGGRVGRSNCGGGLELGLKYTSSDGRTRVDATIEGTEVGGTTQERFNLAIERQW